MQDQLATISFEQIEQMVKVISWQGAAVFAIFILWRSGVLGAVASRLRKNGNTENLVEEVYARVTGNHMSDIQKSLDGLWAEVRSLRDELSDVRDRVARIEGRLERNGH